MKSMKTYYYTFLATLFALSPRMLFAQPGSSGGSGAIQNPLNSSFSTFPAFMAAVLDIVVKVGAPIAVVMVIYAGMLFVLARGNDEKLKEAKRALLWALIGTMILLGAQVIANAISATIADITP